MSNKPTVAESERYGRSRPEYLRWLAQGGENREVAETTLLEAIAVLCEQIEESTQRIEAAIERGEGGSRE